VLRRAVTRAERQRQHAHYDERLVKRLGQRRELAEQGARAQRREMVELVSDGDQSYEAEIEERRRSKPVLLPRSQESHRSDTVASSAGGAGRRASRVTMSPWCSTRMPTSRFPLFSR